MADDLQRIQLYPGNSAFAIQLENGLSIHVEPGHNAALVFQTGDKPIISVKESPTKWTKTIVGAILGLGLAVWWFRKE